VYVYVYVHVYVDVDVYVCMWKCMCMGVYVYVCVCSFTLSICIAASVYYLFICLLTLYGMFTPRISGNWRICFRSLQNRSLLVYLRDMKSFHILLYVLWLGYYKNVHIFKSSQVYILSPCKNTTTKESREKENYWKDRPVFFS